MGCGEGGEHRDWPGPIASRTTWQTGDHVAMAERDIDRASLSQHKTSRKRLPRKVSELHAQAVSAPSAVKRNLQDHGDDVRDQCFGHPPREASQSQLAARSTHEPVADSHRPDDAPLTAYRTWLEQGRGDVPLARLENPGNLCYRNATFAALIVCFHHCHHHPSCDLPRWGCVADIVRAASLPLWRGVEHVPSYVLAVQNWMQPNLQHDVQEFVTHLARTIPILEPPLCTMRIDVLGAVTEEVCPLALHLESGSNTLAACIPQVDIWEWGDTGACHNAFLDHH